jgi:hypothetical protein
MACASCAWMDACRLSCTYTSSLSQPQRHGRPPPQAVAPHGWIDPMGLAFLSASAVLSSLLLETQNKRACDRAATYVLPSHDASNQRGVPACTCMRAYLPRQRGDRSLKRDGFIKRRPHASISKRRDSLDGMAHAKTPTATATCATELHSIREYD